ncbi:MAG: hypothetical protein KAJ49_09945 [Arcobacteraceae bacterium]|nr:hypothetical protein [Arcobacteraceae bacterium]
MIYKNLTDEQKEQISKELNNYAVAVGGINPFLTMIEDIRDARPNALLNKTAIFHYAQGTLNWGKSIFKDTLTTLFDAMRKEEKDGDMINGLKPKEYKITMNMMKILKPITVTINPKDEECGGFSFPILDTTEPKKTKMSLIFKILFFYNIEFAKEALNYEIKDAN